MLLRFWFSTKFILKNAYFKITYVLLVLAIIGLSVVGNYGISWDEESQILMVKWTINFVTKAEPIPGDLKYYGSVFNMASEAAFQINNLFIQKNNPVNLLNKQKGINYFYKRIKIKHVLTFLVSLITYASVAGIVGILTNREYAWFGAVILAFFPRFWGHSFFNPKDIPFAAIFTLATFLGACLVGYYLKANQDDIKLGINRVTFYSLIYGFLVGLVTGIRIGGFFLLFFVGIAHWLTIAVNKTKHQKNYRFWSLYGLMFICWIVTTTIIYPASWSSPIRWFIETLTYLSKHDWNGQVLFEGEFISAHALPWNYLPQWFLITIPGIFIVMFLLGLFLLIIRHKKLNNLQTACIILVLLQIFTLPTIAILKQSTVYDGIRQFLFVIPGIAAIAATALIWIYQKLPRKIYKLFGVVLMITLLSPIVFDIITLHPYEYIYFNRIFGGLAQAYNRYETDYWGLSMREGTEWINNHADANAHVISSDPLHSSKTFADTRINVIPYVQFQQARVTKPFYYIALPRSGFQKKFLECPVVYSVKRQDVPLTIVKKCEEYASN